MNLIVLSLSTCLLTFNPVVTDEYIANIKIENPGSEVIFKGFFQNNSAEEVRFVYRFSLHKNQRGGRSTSNEGGVFNAGPGEEVLLCRLQTELQADESYSVSLSIYRGQQLIAEKTIRSTEYLL